MSVAPAYTTVAQVKLWGKCRGGEVPDPEKADSYRSKHRIDLQGN